VTHSVRVIRRSSNPPSRILASILDGGFDDLRITRTECVTPCPTDIDGDNATGGSDLAMVLSSWGQPGITDLDGNGTTDGSDMAMLLSAWGNCN